MNILSILVLPLLAAAQVAGPEANPCQTIAPLSSSSTSTFRHFAGTGENRVRAEHSVGYFVYDLDAYIADFTICSSLILVKVTAEFTSGWVAGQNGHTEYNSMYDIWSGYIHLAPFQVEEDGGARSSSVYPLITWPITSERTVTVTSGFSSTYNFGFSSSMEAIADGVGAKAGVNGGVSFSFSESVAVSGPEPTLSSQWAPSSSDPKYKDRREWSFNFHAVNAPTYHLETFYLFEVKNDAIDFNDFGFALQIDVRMTCVAYQGWWWESQVPVDHSMLFYVALGRVPEI